MSSLEKRLFSSLAHFLIGSFLQKFWPHTSQEIKKLWPHIFVNIYNLMLYITIIQKSVCCNGSQQGAILPHRGHLAISEDILVFTTWGQGSGRLREVPVTASGWRPEMLLSILKCTVQPPPNKKLSNLIVPGLRNLSIEWLIQITGQRCHFSSLRIHLKLEINLSEY